MRVGVSVAAILMLTGFVAPAAGEEGQSTLFAEDWGTSAQPPSPPSPGWVYSGNTRAECAVSNCALLMQPLTSTLTHARHTVVAPVAGGLTISFRFQGTQTTGLIDGLLQVGFNVGHLHMDMTEGSNNQVALQTTGHSKLIASTWTLANEWYTARTTVDGNTRTATMSLYSPTGELLGTTAATPLPSGATSVAYADFQSARFGPGPTLRVDDLLITNGAGATLLVEDWGSLAHDFRGWQVTGSEAGVDCTQGIAPCSLALDPSCCGEQLYVSKDVGPITDLVKVSFAFRISGAVGDSDSAFEIRLAGTDVHIETTYGAGSTTARLVTTQGGSVALGTWTSNSWHRVNVLVAPTLGWTVARMYPEGATTIPVYSAQVAFTPSPGGIVQLRHSAVDWVASGAVYRYDDIAVVPAFLPKADAGSDACVVLGERATYDGRGSQAAINGAPLVSYAWQFPTPPALSGAVVQRTPPASELGNTTTTLTVKDADGLSATDTKAVLLTGVIVADVAMSEPTYGVRDRVFGAVTASGCGRPLSFALATVVVRFTTGDPELDEAIALALGQPGRPLIEWSGTGLLSTQGTYTFEVPHTIAERMGVSAEIAHLPSDYVLGEGWYEVEAQVKVGQGAHAESTTTYRVLLEA